jgi:transposase
MKLHGNARTCPKSRHLLVGRLEAGWSPTEAAEAAGVSERTAAKWLARWRAEGETGLLDRSSAPKARPTQLPADRVEAIEALRRLRMSAAEIAECLGLALSTVSRWLQRIGLGRLSRLQPPEPANRSGVHATACAELGLRHTSSPGPTGPAPTARPSASSRR